MEIDQICDVDNNFEDPQLCATLASDIYMHLRETEVTHSCLHLVSSKIRNCFHCNIVVLIEESFITNS